MTTPETRMVYHVAASLDGFIATEDDSIDWLFPLGSPGESSYPEFVADVGAIAMGSATYEWIRRNVEKAQAEAGSAWPYAQPARVFTKRKLEAVPGADIRFFSGHAAAAHAEMRPASRGNNIWIVGGGDLAGQFYDAGLLDEIMV
jgi:dihydrofolate reductase